MFVLAGCLEEGVYTPIFSGDALSLYSHCVEADEEVVMILFVPNNTLTESQIKLGWFVIVFVEYISLL